MIFGGCSADFQGKTVENQVFGVFEGGFVRPNGRLKGKERAGLRGLSLDGKHGFCRGVDDSWRPWKGFRTAAWSGSSPAKSS